MAKPVLSPERAALAAQIEADRPLISAVDAARQKVERAQHFLAQAQDRQRAAEQALAEAREMAMAGGQPDGAEMRRLREAADDANEDAGLARTSLQRQEQALADAERAARYAVDRIDRVAGAVLLAEAESAYAAAREAAQNAARLAWVARFLAGTGNPFDGEQHRLTLRADALNASIMWGGSDPSGAEQARRQAVAPWAAALVALKSDPAAPLPKVG